MGVLFVIGLLAVCEGIVGVLGVSGGRRTQLGYGRDRLALWLFGWIETVWCIAMLPPMLRREEEVGCCRVPAGVWEDLA